MAMRGLPEVVEELYRLYPWHVGKKAAERAIKNALKRLALELKVSGSPNVGDEHQWLKEQVSAFAESPAGTRNGLFKGYMPPYPSTWFNQSRYLDDQEAWYPDGIRPVEVCEVAIETPEYKPSTKLLERMEKERRTGLEEARRRGLRDFSKHPLESWEVV